MTADEVIARAKSNIGKRTIYKLGHGGMRPDSPLAADDNLLCDCSGFAAWCLKVSRKTDNPWYKEQNGGWFETTAIFKDCATPFGVFDGVDWKQAKPADLLVWGDHDGKQGHIGIISDVDEYGPKYVIHCSAGNYRALGDAISKTDSMIFKQNNAIVARCAWVMSEQSGSPGGK